jgi:hypothetical protein
MAKNRAQSSKAFSLVSPKLTSELHFQQIWYNFAQMNERTRTSIAQIIGEAKIPVAKG